MRKKNDTVRYTAKQIKAKIAKGEDRTDWRKTNAVTGKKLEASIKADMDDVHGEPDWTQATMGVPMPKGGYQTLMNNVLRAFVQARQQRDNPRSK